MWNRSSIDRIRHRRLFTMAALAAAGLAIVSCGSGPEPEEVLSPASIPSMTVELVTVPDYWEALGTVRSTTRSTIASRMMGTVVSTSVNEGDRVRRGDPLLEIDSREIDAQIRKAEAGLIEMEQSIEGTSAALAAAGANHDLARSTFERYEALRERRSVSPQEFDEVEARFKASSAERTRMERQLEALRARREQALADLTTARTYGTWARVTSPVDGVVTARWVDVGDQAGPGMPLVAIDDPSSHRLEVQVDESRIGSIRIGQPVPIHVESLGIDTRGVIDAIAPAVDPATRTALVKIGLHESQQLQSGMFARAYFQTGERRAIVVPESLVEHRGQLEGIWVVDQSGEASFRLIRTGSAIGGDVEVLSGLREGERIVTEPVSMKDDRAPLAMNAAGRTAS